MIGRRKQNETNAAIINRARREREGPLLILQVVSLVFILIVGYVIV